MTDTNNPGGVPFAARARNSGHKPLNDQVREDWRKLVERHPDSFDALIYMPSTTPQEPEEGEEKALFGTVDRQQEATVYDLPVPISVLEATSDDVAFDAQWDDPEHVGTGESGTLTLLLSAVIAPMGSVIEFEEEQADGSNRRVWWYIHSVNAVGSAAVGALHVCIPCGDLEQDIAQAVQAAVEAAHDAP